MLCIILLLGYMVFQREKEISLLKGTTTTAAESTTTTLSEKQLQIRQLLAVAEQDATVKDFISKGVYQIYLDILDESDFNSLPAIYRNLTRENLFQLNYTRDNHALLVILTPEKVLKVVPLTAMKIT